MRKKCFGLSDIGKCREENQDTFALRYFGDNIVLAVVCDGMGGAAGGRVAAELAISVFVERFSGQFLEKFPNPDGICEEDQAIINTILTDSVDEANNAVYLRARHEPQLLGMGTTLVAALVTDSCAFIVNVGDSRVYFFGRNAMWQVTRDHSHVQMLIDIGQIHPSDAEKIGGKNMIARAVGAQSLVNAETFFLPMSRDETLLLCSDGLYGAVSNEDMYAAIWGSDEIHTEPPEKIVSRLIELANQSGGRDNITAVLVNC